MGKITRVKYFTKDKIDLINPNNIKKYDKYLKSCIIKNKDVKESTYRTYSNYMRQFLVYLSEDWDNIDLYSEEFMDDAIEIMEGFISFCQETLLNNKKVINTKLSAVSSFFIWSMRRKLVSRHPFDRILERVKGASEEKIINAYFLTDEQVGEIQKGLIENKDNKYKFIDIILWNVMLDSANRIGCIDRLTLSSLDLDNCCFKDIREKEGYIIDVSFSEATKELIMKWLEIRKESMDNLEIDALFISKNDKSWKKMSKGNLQRRIKEMGKIIGLDDFHAHCIRKTASNGLLNKGIDPSLVSKFLNHKSVSTTISFYQKPKSASDVRDEIKNQLKELLNK